jgi:hypothetical protein
MSPLNEYVETASFADEDIPFFDECMIAHYILDRSYSNPNELIDDVANKFKLKREVAILILDSKSFHRVLDKMLKVKDTLLGVTIINGLAMIMETGNIKEKMKAIKMLDYLYRISQRENR